MALWLVRAGSRGEREDLALEKNLAVIGWDDLPDLSNIKEREQLRELLNQTYPDDKPKTLLNWESQLWAFINVMEKGDLVSLPLKGRPVIVIGEVEGSYKYLPDMPPDARHTRSVKWISELPRNAIDQDLLYSFGAFLTVCQIKRNNAEERLKALLIGNKVPDNNSETEVPLDLEQYARDQVRDFINRKLKGHGLARLVASVLEAQGYKVRISPEGPDGGIDIIAGHGIMGFDDPKLAVQVKSGESPVDVKVVRELQGVMKNYGAGNGLVVSWGGYKSSVFKEAARLYFEIRLWDSDDLVQMVQANYERFPEALQAELPLKRIWTLVQSED